MTPEEQAAQMMQQPGALRELHFKRGRFYLKLGDTIGIKGGDHDGHYVVIGLAEAPDDQIKVTVQLIHQI